MYKRIFLIVIDSVGVGELPDAKDYNDTGANTLKNLSIEAGGIKLPLLEKLGIGNITDIKGVKRDFKNSFFGKMKELSIGKDTMTGHWEMMGLKVTKPFKTFTDTGFPTDLISELEEKSGRKIIGNISASGTEIIKELGERHLKTGEIIVYTSADSVLQIAANEEVVPLEELYSICKIAREITLKDEWRVGRIIARPFIGQDKNTFKRTPNRHDYALEPFDRTVLNELKDASFDVVSVGKIYDIFNGSGITESHPIKSNHDGMNKVSKLIDKNFNGLCFINLVDFDALYGHRRDSIGYKNCLEEFDYDLSNMIDKLSDDDLLIITADHGNDPTFAGTDHTREYVPLLVYNKKLVGGELKVRESFSDLGATIGENFKVKSPKIGDSFLSKLK
ncbi:phosphopentomutase [Mycoplasmatota bacterium zrk1]